MVVNLRKSGVFNLNRMVVIITKKDKNKKSDKSAAKPCCYHVTDGCGVQSGSTTVMALTCQIAVLRAANDIICVSC